MIQAFVQSGVTSDQLIAYFPAWAFAVWLATLVCRGWSSNAVFNSVQFAWVKPRDRKNFALLPPTGCAGFSRYRVILASSRVAFAAFGSRLIRGEYRLVRRSLYNGRAQRIPRRSLCHRDRRKRPRP